MDAETLLTARGTSTSSKRASEIALIPNCVWPKSPFSKPLDVTEAETRTGRWYTPDCEAGTQRTSFHSLTKKNDSS